MGNSLENFSIIFGSRPVVPRGWADYSEFLITTDQFFELEELPSKVAVIGLGEIGIEIGQVLNRLGIEIVAAGLGKSIGGVTDPKLQDYIYEKLSEEMPLYTNGANIKGHKGNKLIIEVDGREHLVDKAILTMGRRSNLDRLEISTLTDEIDFSRETLALKGFEHIFLAGDANGERTILHEAVDEGVIAGYNAVNDPTCFKQRPALGITFSDPNIATIGKRYSELENFVRGIAMKLTVSEMLTMPFYHPVIEEGLRTALRSARDQLSSPPELEIMRCADTPIR